MNFSQFQQKYARTFLASVCSSAVCFLKTTIEQNRGETDLFCLYENADYAKSFGIADIYSYKIAFIQISFDKLLA